MGVLACDRQGCTSVMCDYYSESFGYICYTCLSELKNLNGGTTIFQFMNSPSVQYKHSYEWENYVESEFKSRYED